MPQLVVADFLPQLFWLVLTFATLYLVLANVYLPRIASVREDRAKRVSADLDAAESLKRQADEAKVAYEASLAAAKATAQKIVADTQDAIKLRSETRQHDVAAKINADADAAEAQIQAAKAEALAGIRDVAADVCRDIVAKVAGITVDDAAIRQAVDAKFKAAAGGQG